MHHLSRNSQTVHHIKEASYRENSKKTEKISSTYHLIRKEIYLNKISQTGEHTL